MTDKSYSSSVQVLPGIVQRRVRTRRLEMACLAAGEGQVPLVLVHGNCSSSHFFQNFMLALAGGSMPRGECAIMPMIWPRWCSSSNCRLCTCRAGR
ncbi:MAG TPA: hypothetical protein VGF67_32710 [Ktedonobacteraceae bacterium]